MRKTLSSLENEAETQRQGVHRLQGELEERGAELAALREEQEKREQELTKSCQRQLHTQLAETKEVSL